MKDFTKTEGHRSSTCSVIQLFSIQRTFQLFKNEDTYLEEKKKIIKKNTLGRAKSSRKLCLFNDDIALDKLIIDCNYTV